MSASRVTSTLPGNFGIAVNDRLRGHEIILDEQRLNLFQALVRTQKQLLIVECRPFLNAVSAFPLVEISECLYHFGDRIQPEFVLYWQRGATPHKMDVAKEHVNAVRRFSADLLQALPPSCADVAASRLKGMTITDARYAVEQVLECALYLDNRGDYCGPASAREQATLQIVTLAAALIGADGRLEQDELRFLSSLLGDQYSPAEVRNLIRSASDEGAYRSVLFERPHYVTDLIRIDTHVGEGSLNGPLLRQSIITIGGAVIISDGAVSPQELTLLNLHLRALRHGKVDAEPAVEQVLVEYGAPSPVVPAVSMGTRQHQSPVVEVEESVDSTLRELDALVGLEPVKARVKQLVNLARVSELRRKQGVPAVEMSHHLVFTGNPGTGKTTVARLVARMYRALGLISKGHLVEVDRSKLVARFVGQTSIQVQEVVASAMGGVLFIDEAYALTVARGEGDYGAEAVDTLLKLMEDNRRDLVVIVAGYPGKMSEFVASNPGLRSRFASFVHFPDYSAEEMVRIFTHLADKNHYSLDDEAMQSVRDAMHHLRDGAIHSFGNGRDVRSALERAIVYQACRLAAITSPTRDDLLRLRSSDIRAAVGA